MKFGGKTGTAQKTKRSESESQKNRRKHRGHPGEKEGKLQGLLGGEGGFVLIEAKLKRPGGGESMSENQKAEKRCGGWKKFHNQTFFQKLIRRINKTGAELQATRNSYAALEVGSEHQSQTGMARIKKKGIPPGGKNKIQRWQTLQ